MRARGWAAWLLRRLAPEDRVEDLVGDLEEGQREREARYGPRVARLLKGFETLDLVRALLWTRYRDRETRISWIDLKLGVRMLVKHPGVTVVGVVAIAFGVCVGAVVFQEMTNVFHPNLGLPDSDRIVELALENERGGLASHGLLHDFVTWRAELESVEGLSAYRTVRRNLVPVRGQGSEVIAAEISASAFDVAGVAPLLGRTLVGEDEGLGAPAVVVLGYDLWQVRFEGDPSVLGRSIRLGGTETAVVGVMPEGFAFPLAHAAWVPLRLEPLRYAYGEGPALGVVGRLAPGVSLEQAQAELSTLASAIASEHPEATLRLRPFVRPYRGGIVQGPEVLLGAAYPAMVLLPVLLLALVCANIALMVFARTAARERELLVRSALGASRRRIVTQLFGEALVLASAGAALGLVAADFGVSILTGFYETEAAGMRPYWLHSGLDPTTVIYAGLFTVIGAAIVGVVPALKATSTSLRGRLQSAAAGGGGLRMGGLWTAVIVAQVGVTVAVMPWVTTPVAVAATGLWSGGEIPVRDFLTASVATDREAAARTALYSIGSGAAGAPTDFLGSVRELEERLAREPGVAGVAVASGLPGSPHSSRRVELGSRQSSHIARTAVVDPNYFELVGIPLVAGRGFEPEDLDADEGVVVVNEEFVRWVLEEPGAVGQRLRHPPTRRAAETSTADLGEPPWYRIVGVVRDRPTRVGMESVEAAVGNDAAMVYHLLAPGEAYPLALLARTREPPATLAPRLRALAADVDPTLRLTDLMPLDEAVARGTRPLTTGLLALLLTGALALLLSNAGIYSAMAFAVSRRTREIGVRVALGASRTRLVASVLGHSMFQVGLGIGVGAFLLLATAYILSEGELVALVSAGGRGPLIAAGTLAYLAVMLAFCALACVVPTRRVLAIEPTEALKAEG